MAATVSEYGQIFVLDKKVNSGWNRVELYVSSMHSSKENTGRMFVGHV